MNIKKRNGDSKMNTRELIEKVLNNPEACELLQKLLIPVETPAPATKQNTWYVYCAEMTNNNDGKKYYHPVVSSANGYSMPSLDELMNPETYQMIAYQNQFDAHAEKAKIDTIVRMTGQTILLVNIPDETYQILDKALHDLMDNILAECEVVFESIDNIAKMTRKPASGNAMKMSFMMSVLQNLDTLYECFDANMVVTDSEDHDYTVETEDEWEGYDGEDEDYDEDEDDWDE